jgi:hypothetical protein
MNKIALIIGILFILISLVVFIFADGMRRYYSGIFFAFLGIVALMQAFRSCSRANK